MELTKKDIKILKGIAILFMLLLHLFCTKQYDGLYTPIIIISGIPLVYQFASFGGICVAIYLFCSGYGLAISYENNKEIFNKNNKVRILKLLINYWIILILFVTLGFILGHGSEYPGSLVKFIMNFFLLSKSYNGAWWFLQTYVILIVLSRWIIRVVKKYNSIIIFFISGIIHFIAFIQSIKGVVDLSGIPILKIIESAITNLGVSQFVFVVAIIFEKGKIYSKIKKKLDLLKCKGFCVGVGLISIFIINCVVENGVIKPLIAISFIVCFTLISKGEIVENTLVFFSKHSTNMWLIHMFFYMIFFKEIIFKVKYSFFIFPWLIILCVIASYGINLIYNPIIKIIDEKLRGGNNDQILIGVVNNLKDNII